MVRTIFTQSGNGTTLLNFFLDLSRHCSSFGIFFQNCTTYMIIVRTDYGKNVRNDHGKNVRNAYGENVKK